MREQFTYYYYKSLLQLFKEKEYTFATFSENMDTRKNLYLRHDIDITLEYLPSMIDIELELGAFSTCFIMVNNEFYNILSSRNMSIIRECSEKGAIFGLHIDPNFMNRSPPSYFSNKFIDDLEAIFQFYSLYIPLSRVISWHRPAMFITDDQMYNKIGQFANAYESRFFKEIIYISDSNRRRFWEESRLSEAIAQNQSIQLLTHPLWWKEQEQTDDFIFTQMLELGSNTIRHTITTTIKRYM